MISIDEFEELVRKAADELPDRFFDELQGGVAIIEGEKFHPKSADGDIYVMGEYVKSETGNVIYMYYGSFAAAYCGYDKEALYKEVRRVLRHEFRHHVEGMAGIRELEDEDAQALEELLKRRR